MKVALIKATARRTPTGLVTEKEEILDILTENPDELLDRLAIILASYSALRGGNAVKKALKIE